MSYTEDDFIYNDWSAKKRLLLSALLYGVIFLIFSAVPAPGEPASQLEIATVSITFGLGAIFSFFSTLGFAFEDLRLKTTVYFILLTLASVFNFILDSQLVLLPFFALSSVVICWKELKQIYINGFWISLKMQYKDTKYGLIDLLGSEDGIDKVLEVTYSLGAIILAFVFLHAFGTFFGTAFSIILGIVAAQVAYKIPDKEKQKKDIAGNMSGGFLFGSILALAGVVGAIASVLLAILALVRFALEQRKTKLKEAFKTVGGFNNKQDN